MVTFLLELLKELRKKLGPNGGDQRWEFIRKQESKKTRKQELDQESDQENQNHLDHFLDGVLVFFYKFPPLAIILKGLVSRLVCRGHHLVLK